MAHGGIQRYNRTLIRAARELCADRGGALRVLSLNDPPGTEGLTGFGGSARALVRHALFQAWQDRPDVVIVGHVRMAPVIPAYRTMLPATHVYTVAHGKEVERRVRSTFLLGLHLSTGVLAVSESTRQCVSTVQRVPSQRVHLLRYGFDLQGRGDMSTLSEPADGLSLLTVARLERQDAYKGVDVAIRALALLRDRHPNLRYTVVGSGDDLERLRTRSEEHT